MFVFFLLFSIYMHEDFHLFTESTYATVCRAGVGVGFQPGLFSSHFVGGCSLPLQQISGTLEQELCFGKGKCPQ
jgi:hypothetical protein